MNQEQFIETMTELVSLKKDADAIGAALKKLDPDFNFFTLGRAETLIMKILKIAVGDTYDYIGYWLFELDSGKKWREGMINTKEGKDIPLKTLAQLYKHIKSN